MKKHTKKELKKVTNYIFESFSNNSLREILIECAVVLQSGYYNYESIENYITKKVAEAQNISNLSSDEIKTINDVAFLLYTVYALNVDFDIASEVK